MLIFLDSIIPAGICRCRKKQSSICVRKIRQCVTTIAPPGNFSTFFPVAVSKNRRKNRKGAFAWDFPARETVRSTEEFTLRTFPLIFPPNTVSRSPLPGSDAPVPACAPGKIAEGITTKNVSCNGTVIDSHIGLNTDTKIPELRTLFISGDIATTRAGTNAICYREESSASIFNAQSVQKKRFLSITMNGGGDILATIRAIADSAPPLWKSPLWRLKRPRNRKRRKQRRRRRRRRRQESLRIHLR